MFLRRRTGLNRNHDAAGGGEKQEGGIRLKYSFEKDSDSNNGGVRVKREWPVLRARRRPLRGDGGERSDQLGDNGP